MVQHIYVNLAVSDLKATMSFFKQLGFSFNLEYTNDQAACLVLADNIFAMLLTRDFFRTFINKEICDTSKAVEVLTCVSLGSRKELDALIDKARAAGGKVSREARDHGFMYENEFEDLDGHIWSLVTYEGR